MSDTHWILRERRRWIFPGLCTGRSWRLECLVMYQRQVVVLSVEVFGQRLDEYLQVGSLFTKVKVRRRTLPRWLRRGVSRPGVKP